MRRSSYRLTVRGYELDSFGHVNNSVYLQYAETALWNFFKVHGLLAVIVEEGLFPVVMESTQRYIHELRLLDEVRIDTEVSCSGGIVSYKHNIINKSTGLVSCRVTGKLAYVNKERIICDIPEAVRACLEGEDEDNDNNRR
ncbi:MAG: acyl-CoA thioesterase [Ruminococcus sp.]|uniref:acyl-CoA thioesterase n=1 Tax=Ruminococcus sp. TaxID=41978 RepID=UPI0025EC550B|nr:thioesterase family protein [Ruminococcus sp.]MBR6994716.1 acyl-CoA thioesterase [Ruminococcus sp.]